MMIKLKKGLYLKVLKEVRIRDDCWDMPGGGILNPGAIVQITSSPTRVSDVPFKVIEGSGEVTHRNRIGEIKMPIEAGSKKFYFSQGHNTVAPYDYGTLDFNYYEQINDK